MSKHNNSVESKKVPSYIHVNNKKGTLNPEVVMKKIRLRPSDETDRNYQRDSLLPELHDDDEKDRSQYTEQRKEKQGQVAKVSGNEDQAFLTTMSHDEVNEHFKKCLELSSENKITPKNAFALQLIDCLNLLFDKKNDFPTMACTLDAGAKIYSSRVDALHQQVIKLADEVILHQKDKRSERNEKQDEHEKSRKDRRKTSKRNVIAASETIVRKIRGKDPRDKFIKVDALPGAIISGVRRDPKDLAFSLENNIAFWPNWGDYKPVRAEGMVTLPAFKILRRKDMNADKIKEVLNTSQIPAACERNYVNMTDLESLSQTSKHQHQQSSDLCCDPNPNYFNSPDVEDAPATHPSQSPEEEVDIISTAMKRLNEEAGTNGAINTAANRFHAMKIIFDKCSEYHYLDMRNSLYWAGPEFWKRPKLLEGKNGEPKKRNARRKKEPEEITYDHKPRDFDKKWENSDKKSYNLARKTVLNWKSKKCSTPKDLKFDEDVFLELFHISRNKDPIENIEESVCFVDVTKGHESSLEPSDSLSSQDPLNTTFYDGVPGNSTSSDDKDSLNSAFYDVGLVQIAGGTEDEGTEMESGKVIKVQISTSDSPMFGGATLVPAPKIIKIQPITYSTKPNRVNMQHLKETMLDVIRENIETATKAREADSTVEPETDLRSILQKLPRRLEEITAQDLSPGMGLMALLTLANENNLQLRNCEDMSNVLVRLEATVTSS